MRKVFLDNLPIKEGFGANKGKMLIDWKSSVGYKVRFIYEHIEDYVTIDKCEKGNIYISNEKYKINFFINCVNFKKCALGSFLGLISSDYKIEIGKEFIDSKRNIVIIDRETEVINHPNGINENKKWYKYKCKKCGYEGSIVESNVLAQKQGCSCCSGTAVILGINTIWDTDRWMVDLGISEEDAKTHRRWSNKKVVAKCPFCNKSKKVTIGNVCKTKSIGCICGDGFSYPEKFMSSVLDQLQINYITQYTPDYLSRKFSDFYVPYLNLVIETDGLIGHKDGVSHRYSNKTLKESVDIDIWKDEQHLKNGIKTVRINCFESNMEYIRDNILNSDLKECFDFKHVDWNKCDEYAVFTNFKKQVCDYWNNKEDSETTKDLSEIFGIHASTAHRWVKEGSLYGWCEYDAKSEGKKRGQHLNEIRDTLNIESGKPVMVLLNGVNQCVCRSVSVLSKESVQILGVNLRQNSIYRVINGRRKSLKGYTFQYITKEEYENYKLNKNNEEVA